ncbi:MAG TPA: sn-glycerol-1-phosphate dehydrogenase [Aggregatilinea sp.]|uniref:sn-glycerol-1-phosphate dehydrogenase n=1 Tax=Aggregatilinea sp. TaxID=2806333 RepID=UPI002B6FDAC8|nr:sn-glycerol-1-phosphate dehydrogenase [Aggregatilinea sp.]HML22384.1 sn-glycerol-1-phosphate dehydrogenase [Aggregatilinea sp.]
MDKDHPVEIVIGQDAIERLVQFCATLPEPRLTMVADTNTYAALGERVESALKAAGLDVLPIVLRGEEVAADEKHLVEVLVKAPPVPQTFLAVGSGTITDIARYISYRTGNKFISVPTAASVDGFVSTGAPLVVGGIKDTYPSHGPYALFADLPTLVDAPRPLTAAGFGDILGKAISLADWRLGQLLWNEPYSPDIAGRTRRTLDECIRNAEDIRSGSAEALHALLDGLIESGMCILDFGNSRPASGAEHHCSHFWEMQLLRLGRPAILHGAKVGYAAILMSQLYAQIRALTQDEVARFAADAPAFSRAAQIEEIRTAYGDSADGIIQIQQPFLSLSEADVAQIKQRIVDEWPTIQEIAATVPPPEAVTLALETVGAPVSWRTLGLPESVVAGGPRYGHYLRNRFTILKLFGFLGLDAPGSIEYV